MRWAAKACLCLLTGLLVASPGSALDWEVNSYVFATEKPNGFNSSYVWGRGTHQLAVTRVKLIDSIIPFRFKISHGELRWEGQGMDACATPWKWASDQFLFQECRTYAMQAPCDDGAWTAAVTGKLDFHPAGGIRFSITVPNRLNCACT